MSDGINGSENTRNEYREREINGGSTKRELWDDARRNKLVISPERTLKEKSFEEWLAEETARIISKERCRIAGAMKRSPVVEYDMRDALLKIIFDKGEG
jgi:hypothetical protein